MAIRKGADTQTELVLRNGLDVDATDKDGSFVSQEVQDSEYSRAFAAMTCE